jgi:hypothetical protein
MVLAFAGAMVLLGTVLAVTVSSRFLLLTGFVGANLLQSSFTGFCPLAKILKRAGCRCGTAFQ